MYLVGIPGGGIHLS